MLASAKVMGSVLARSCFFIKVFFEDSMNAVESFIGSDAFFFRVKFIFSRFEF